MKRASVDCSDLTRNAKNQMHADFNKRLEVSPRALTLTLNRPFPSSP